MGGLWACSEVVLGGFLHSARVPLRGNILTAIGIAILAAGRKLWPGRGLLWRAGLICAGIKLLSPGTVKLGPMIAIAMEGALMEAPGLLGGGLAMSWTFLHKIASILFFYGSDGAAVYRGLWEGFASWAGRPAMSPWLALSAAGSLHFLAGAAAAFAGGQAVAQAAIPASPAVKPGPAVRKARGFWPGLALMCVLAAAVLGPERALIMGLRAAAVWLLVAAIAARLKRPAARRWLERRGAGAFLRALDQTIAAMPAMIAGLPEGRRIALAPLSSLGQIIGQAPRWLAEIDKAPGCRAHIIAGAQGSGKSTLAADLAQALRERGVKVGGVSAPGLWAAGERDGFDVRDLAGGNSVPLCRKSGPDSWTSQGPFRFSPQGLELGRKALAAAAAAADVIIVDEVGPLELRGEGWAPELDVLARRGKPMAWVVRESLVQEVCRAWNLTPMVWRAGQTEAPRIAAEILKDAGT